MTNEPASAPAAAPKDEAEELMKCPICGTALSRHAAAGVGPKESQTKFHDALKNLKCVHGIPFEDRCEKCAASAPAAAPKDVAREAAAEIQRQFFGPTKKFVLPMAAIIQRIAVAPLQATIDRLTRERDEAKEALRLYALSRSGGNQ